MATRTELLAKTVRDEDLPASFRFEDHSLASPCDHLERFLTSDLSVGRIEKVASHLWMVGRPHPPRALNLQAVLKREIVPCSDASLHLVWAPGKIFVKPLPRYFLSPAFYERYLQGDDANGPALGFLFTYVSLVPTELDFELAQERHLFPSDSSLTWEDWKSLCRKVLKSYPGTKIYDCKSLPMRYKYGELRLSRLNKIHRCFGGDWLHGYSNMTGLATYGQFFSAHLGFITGFTVYVVLVLTAMQVGLATTQLGSNLDFIRACYGFSVFSIIGPIVAGGAVALLFFIIFFANWARAIVAKRARFGRFQNEEEKRWYNK
ncbi:hypothetical protein CKM354_000232500 [Cercospora kikuchii]|uniref:Subtilisin-like serine protease n=1 Tax=Cercospora kikuchii TaxID=84275 RepID=A0A9P3FCN6_9PEZI|nr:uncharacterized protein CKM354_000232500 [Cercospora kikuchii]GIZ38927.1 hypothetical protein CKM354_000232500 [Cercospora kikuchii]